MSGCHPQMDILLRNQCLFLETQVFPKVLHQWWARCPPFLCLYSRFWMPRPCQYLPYLPQPAKVSCHVPYLRQLDQILDRFAGSDGLRSATGYGDGEVAASSFSEANIIDIGNYRAGHSKGHAHPVIQYAGFFPAAGARPAWCHSTTTVCHSLCPRRTEQDELQQPSPTGDREELRARPKSGTKRARESSRSRSRSGDLSPSECGDRWSQGCCPTAPVTPFPGHVPTHLHSNDTESATAVPGGVTLALVPEAGTTLLLVAMVLAPACQPASNAVVLHLHSDGLLQDIAALKRPLHSDLAPVWRTVITAVGVWTVPSRHSWGMRKRKVQCQFLKNRLLLRLQIRALR